MSLLGAGIPLHSRSLQATIGCEAATPITAMLEGRDTQQSGRTAVSRPCQREVSAADDCECCTRLLRCGMIDAHAGTDPLLWK